MLRASENISRKTLKKQKSSSYYFNEVIFFSFKKGVTTNEFLKNYLDGYVNWDK